MTSQAQAADTANFNPATLRRFIDGEPYLGEFETGLYPGAKNEIPPAHQAAGVRTAATIGPLDKQGQPDAAAGKCVAVVLGHSNCNQYFTALGKMFEEKKAELNPAFVLLNSAVGGQQLPEIMALQGKVWDKANALMAERDLAPAQVQAVFFHTTWHGAQNRQKVPPRPFPANLKDMQNALAKVLTHCVKIFPNLKVAYLTCDGFRHYTGFEPHVWQEAFGYKWLVASQIRGDAEAAFEGKQRVLPWLQWGPYIWDNHWDESYFTDGVHPAPHTERIFSTKYWNFLKNDPVAKGWLVRA